MNFPKLDELIAKVEARIDDPAKREEVASIVNDLVQASALALVTPDLAERRIVHLKAQVAGLGAIEAGVVSSEISTWMMSVVSNVIRGALVG